MADELRWSREETKAALDAYVGKIDSLFQRAGLQPEATSGPAVVRASAD
jgi:hypothetical protein